MMNHILLYSGRMVDDGDINGGGGGFILFALIIIGALIYSACKTEPNTNQ